ncbi:uncharacterized protein PV07_04822 [Cladophialophora immunda]|uniref:Uncharacterized protein n=1 Tax=Cladophialophora immunda TaxID=569365 RepID=A0A0D1ZM05_9EURO|nr:uncharacterized protein PV07_04822 [Cladophialophora immunda]KIW28971.1 hypothetical protein PV07_04822 [Cladophialophora immunda]OQU98620.1 hypothetical protein CLAIMM_04377 isoform 1 [Cladophialophora immunda]OQU98621.1 hypothetical protein CLAIMM_04377 isoform 2 [Cladophialophora immunda]
MAPAQSANSKQELSTKDAMFLLELMRDSPQAILFHIGPYCQKTGTKPNTIVKRLGEIKKRNRLNIVTTTSPPGGGNSNFAAPRVSSAVKRERGGDDSEAKPKVKGEWAPKTGKQHAPEALFTERVKVETSSSHGLGSVAAYGLPSPAESAAGTPFMPVAAAGGVAASPMAAAGAIMAQIPLYMPQKRSSSDREEYERDSSANRNGVTNKKIKTEI